VPLTRFTFLQQCLRDCLGFIIDGDLAIKWKEPSMRANHRSVGTLLTYARVLCLTILQGTLPFISYRVLDAWSIKENALHTAIDDLESFAWVLLWAGLHASPVKTHKEASWIEGLSRNNFGLLAAQKCAILHHKFRHKDDFSPHLVTLSPLLKKWFALAWTAKDALDEVLDRHGLPPVSDEGSEEQTAQSDEFILDLEELCLDYYKRYLEKAVEFLNTKEP
jgi:hypothetical protein